MVKKSKLAERFNKREDEEEGSIETPQVEEVEEVDEKPEKPVAKASAILNDLTAPAVVTSEGRAERTVRQVDVKIPQNASRMEDYPTVIILATESINPSPVVGSFHFGDGVEYKKGKEFVVPYPVASFLTEQGVAAILRT